MMRVTVIDLAIILTGDVLLAVKEGVPAVRATPPALLSSFRPSRPPLPFAVSGHRLAGMQDVWHLRRETR